MTFKVPASSLFASLKQHLSERGSKLVVSGGAA
jgi:hypothetical protein